MRVGLIAEKVGMTQYFDDNGVLKAITILKVDPCTVVALRTKDHDGVESVQLGTRTTIMPRVHKLTQIVEKTSFSLIYLRICVKSCTFAFDFAK